MLILRQQNSQDRIEGREPSGWADTDYAVLDDETRVGRIYKEQLPGGEKWLWFLKLLGAVPNTGNADTLEDAIGCLKAAYERNRGGQHEIIKPVEGQSS